MIGKASEIKCLFAEGRFNSGGLYPTDCGIPEDAEILDIKFSTCYDPDYGNVIQTALIIYKEATK